MLLREKVGLRPRTQKRYPPLKGYKRWLLREMVGPRPWTFGGFLWGVSVFLSRWLHPISSSTAASVCVLGLRVLGVKPKVTDVNDIFEGSLPRVSRWPRSWHSRELHGGRDRGILAWQPNQFAPAAEGCPVCSTSRGQPPTWCDLWRCREMITKLHFEGVRRDIPGPTPSHQAPARAPTPQLEEGCLRDIPGGGCPRIFYMTGTNPRTGHHWTAFLCPVIRRRRRHCGIPTGEK